MTYTKNEIKNFLEYIYFVDNPKTVNKININSRNISAAEEAFLLAKSDLISFGKLFLPDDFKRSETPAFHYEIADLIDNKNIKQLAIVIPRGHGKSILTKAGTLKDFLFDKDYHFYGFVSATQKLAVGLTDYIKYHIQYNEKINYYFGDLRSRDKWTTEDIEIRRFRNPLGYDCEPKKLVSKSNVSGIRGGAKLHRRYDMVCLDDFESEANTITQDARSKNASLITAVVYPALEPHTGRLRVNGTPVHYDSFVNNLLINYRKAQKSNKSFKWTVYTKKAIEKDGSILWPSFFNREIIEEKRQFYKDSGTPAKFYQEYQMEVQSEEDSLFTRDMIQYHDAIYSYDAENDINYLIWNGEKFPVNIFLGCDPATDIDTKDSDFSVIIVVAVDNKNNLYVLDYERHRSIPTSGRRNPDGTIATMGVVDYIFKLYDQYHCTSGTVEDVAMTRSVMQSLDEQRIIRNRFDISIIPEKPGGREKRNKIYSILNGRFSLRTIYLREGHVDLQDEIIMFGPRMSHDDCIESLAFASKNAYPPSFIKNDETGEYSKWKPKAKNWLVA